MQLKPTIILSIFGVLLFTLSGCGSSSSEQSNTPEQIYPKQELSITLDNQDNASSVSISPLNEVCKQSCSKQISKSTLVTLKALPADGYEFLGWNGDCAHVDIDECQLTLDQDKTVSTEFKPLDKTILGISIQGGGNIRTSLGTLCEQDCLITIFPNSQITLTAEPASNNVFTGWGNPICNDDALTCSLEVSENIKIRPTFKADDVQEIIVSLWITGQGSVDVLNTNLSCKDECEIPFSLGESITLVAKASNGHVVESWSNDCTTSSVCSFTVSEDLALGVSFTASTFDKSKNSLLITEPLGINRTNFPIQFARPFIKGEIANYPEIMIEGANLSQQVNVKQRHDDGSVKHAIFNIILDSLPANSSLIAMFKNKATSDNTPLTKEEMLSDALNFDAKMQFTFDEEVSVSARDMINSGHYEPWLQGPIATSIIVKDHSIDRLYDVGADSHKSIRPIFMITFWPTLSAYTVRYLAENINSEALQDQRYNFVLTLGTDEDQVYSKSELFHPAMTRWTKQYSSSEKFNQALSINHNIEYLAKTKAVPNFDHNRNVPTNIITQDWEKWQNKTSDLYDVGLWQHRMSIAGGRPDIGLYPSWVVKWLYTGDWRHQIIATKQAELSAAWPIHIREGRGDLLFDHQNTTNALGRIISMAPNARPKHWLDRPDWHEIKGNSRIDFVNDIANNTWDPDVAHHPDLSSPQYLLTGDYFFLEQMLFSSAYTGGSNNAAAFSRRYGRGQTGAEGALYAGEIRSQAWALRTRLHAFDILPDDHIEKTYHSYLIKSALAQFEGLFELENSFPSHQNAYQHAKTVVMPFAFPITGSPSPIGHWDQGITSPSYVRSDRVNTEQVSRALAPWMHNFVIVALGRANELGFNTSNLLNYAGRSLTRPFANEGIPHIMLAAYIAPSIDVNNQWFTSWAQAYDQYLPDYVTQIENQVTNGLDSEHGYYSIAMSAASYLHEQPEFITLWQYITANIRNKNIYDENPKWALLPRE